jgi:tRNA-specific 2-thiouridylase
MSRKEKVVVGMSGGVDSSVAALLLKQQGYDVVGLFMKNWEDDDDDEYCSTRQDLVDVVSVADVLGIDLEVVNFSKEYKDRVFAEFLREYEAGRAESGHPVQLRDQVQGLPRPRLALGADRIATGHYAQVREWTNDGRTEFQLLKAEDGTKDQSYFLYRLNQAQLSKTLFPLATSTSARCARWPRRPGCTCSKKDSTGICFIGERPFREFLSRYLPAKPGEIRTLEGDKVIGQHQGLMHHTIGQRKGLLIGGIKGNQDEAGEHDAWYVAQKDVAKNVLYVVQSHDHPALAQGSPDCHRAVVGVGPRSAHPLGLPPSRATARRMRPARSMRLAGGRAEIAFAQPQWAVTPGQSVVIYESKVCLGGGIIVG